MSATSMLSFFFYDGTLHREGAAGGHTEAFLDNEWMAIVPSEEELLRRRSIDSADTERIIAEQTRPARPRRYYSDGVELFKLIGSPEPGAGRWAKYIGRTVGWLVQRPSDEARARMREVAGAELEELSAEVDRKVEKAYRAAIASGR